MCVAILSDIDIKEYILFWQLELGMMTMIKTRPKKGKSRPKIQIKSRYFSKLFALNVNKTYGG